MKYVIKCYEAFVCCKTEDLAYWYFDSNPKDERDILTFDTKEDAQLFIEDYDINEAVDFINQNESNKFPYATIEKHPKYKEAEKYQLSLF